MKAKSALIFALLIFVTACSDSGDKKTDLAQEMGARKLINKIDLLAKEGKHDQAREILLELERRFTHTKTFAQAKARLLNAGLSTKSPDITLTGRKLVELENAVLKFRKQTGKWPGPGQINKPLDAWNNETYWVIGTPENSFDLLVVSAGKDGEPGSGDELIMVWTQSPDKKQTGKKRVRKTSAKRKKSAKQNAKVMTLDELMKAEVKAGAAPDKMITLDQLSATGAASRSAGQPGRGETVLSLEELKQGL